ncbi:hypothetical protein BC939DRAFT_273070 [Gamsiella multidivaricata]|uniref:uncharacterized protein n=1 Tax=Gamsiella multidivaricata TaxID=101098 RepID=UPI00221E8DEF|nr:uncharacterized protein BC939DRAFT_273070 [Gamsiella multidivaricata]KAI7819015.1 hypothetical protein BC939DRAFT_273070 [Gamsiella multidivaricata]
MINGENRKDIISHSLLSFTFCHLGLSSRQAPDNTSVVLLDTKTNTWITEYRPRAMSATNTPNSGNGNNGGNNNKSLSIGAVLGLAFLITAAIVGSAFFLLVRRKKRRTRNTVARENLGQTTTRAALGRGRSDSHSRGIFGRISEGFSLGVLSRNGEGHGRGRRPDSRRYSEFSLRAHPMTIMERISELGYSPVSLGYPESVVQIGTGAVSVTSYVYPNQACAKTERLTNGDEAHIIFHDLSMPQKEALRLTREQEQRRNQYLQHQAPKTELLQFVDDD